MKLGKACWATLGKAQILATAVALSALSTQVWAGWKLNGDESSVHFISVKSEQVAEVHHFKTLSGDIEQGKLTLDIDLASVETNIGIRNERMQKMLFEVANFKSATLTADLSGVMQKLKQGKPGVWNVTQPATLALHGKTKNLDVALMVTYDGNSALTASITKPLVIQAADFALEGGVAALQKIAGLPGITRAVPVNASLLFVK